MTTHRRLVAGAPLFALFRGLFFGLLVCMRCSTVQYGTIRTHTQSLSVAPHGSSFRVCDEGGGAPRIRSHLVSCGFRDRCARVACCS